MAKGEIIIGVSKLSPNYAAWLNNLMDGPEIIDLYGLSEEAIAGQFQRFSGLLLPGGSDIHPGLYNRPEDIHHCRDIDTKRDGLESYLIKMALEERMPVLGICRGMQILNVISNGALYADIPSFVNTTIIHKNKEDVIHTVTIKKGTLLYSITHSDEAEVNSAHHQAVSRIAEGFRASAFSPDGLPEAIETDPDIHPFCLAVQWHPERMNLENPMSGLLGKGFMEAATKFRRK